MFELGGMSPAMVDPLKGCLAAFDHIREADSSQLSLELREQQEQVHFGAVVAIAQLLAIEVMHSRSDEFELALLTPTATRDVAATAGVRWLNTFANPFIDHWSKEFLKIALMMRDAAESHADPVMRERCVIARTNYAQNLNGLLLNPDFEWEMYLGRDGEAFRNAMYKYDFDLHHEYLIANFNGDWVCANPGIMPYIYHLGDIDVSLQMIDKQLETVKKAVDLSNEGAFAERVGLCGGMPS